MVMVYEAFFTDLSLSSRFLQSSALKIFSPLSRFRKSVLSHRQILLCLMSIRMKLRTG